MTSASNKQPSIIRTERGLTIAGTRITLYDVLNLTQPQVNAALFYIEEN